MQTLYYVRSVPLVLFFSPHVGLHGSLRSGIWPISFYVLLLASPPTSSSTAVTASSSARRIPFGFERMFCSAFANMLFLGCRGLSFSYSSLASPSSLFSDSNSDSGDVLDLNRGAGSPSLSSPLDSMVFHAMQVWSSYKT